MAVEIPVTFPPGRDRLATKAGSYKVTSLIRRQSESQLVACLAASDCLSSSYKDHINLQTDQFGRKLGKTIKPLPSAYRYSKENVFPLRVPEFTQALPGKRPGCCALLELPAEPPLKGIPIRETFFVFLSVSN